MIDIHSISTKDIYIPTHASTSMKDRKLYSLLFMNGLADTMNSQPIYIYVLYLFTISIFFWKLITFLFLMTNKQICQTEVEKVNTQLIVHDDR
jgi:hypothetical protein